MSRWQHPFAKSTITSVFGTIVRRTSPHRGTDYAPGAKKLIPAVTDSVVTSIFYSECLGWVCEIRSVEHGIYIGHSHLYCNKHDTIDCDGKGHTDGSTCMSKLKVGDSVKVGQWVGRVGNSGTCSRGSHLHLTMSKKPDPRYAKAFDAEKFIDQKIAKQSKAAKKETVKKVAKKPKKAVAGGNKAGRFWTLKK